MGTNVDGTEVGFILGVAVGANVGFLLGTGVGITLGDAVGVLVGIEVGISVLTVITFLTRSPSHSEI